MLKASMPMTVYIVGVLFKTEAYTVESVINIAVVGTGICIASYGEILFVAHGVMLQVASIVTESFRLTLVQILLQQRGIKLNPISTLYHIAPVCFMFLLLPFVYIELPQMYAQPDLRVDVPLLLGSAASAFALNMSVFLLIGRSSALTMNIAGVMKDWLLILLSVLIYGSPVTRTQARRAARGAAAAAAATAAPHRTAPHRPQCRRPTASQSNPPPLRARSQLNPADIRL
jgi:hypothetical protein